MIKDAVAADKYKSGVKELLQSVNGSKLIIISKSIDSDDRTKLEEQAKAADVVVYEYPGPLCSWAKLCNRPF